MAEVGDIMWYCRVSKWW